MKTLYNLILILTICLVGMCSASEDHSWLIGHEVIFAKADVTLSDSSGYRDVTWYKGTVQDVNDCFVLVGG